MKGRKEIGILMTWFDTRGFGFIHNTVDGEVRAYFAHISQIAGQPKAGASVRFEPSTGKKGLAAINVEILEPTAGLDALKAGV